MAFCRRSFRNTFEGQLQKQIQKQLLKAGILLKDARHHVFFDTEQACLLEHNGDWERRLAVN